MYLLKNYPEKTDESYEQLWKKITMWQKLNDLYAKYYSPTEHLAVDEIILLFNDTKSHFQTT